MKTAEEEVIVFVNNPNNNLCTLVVLVLLSHEVLHTTNPLVVVLLVALDKTGSITYLSSGNSVALAVKAGEVRFVINNANTTVAIAELLGHHSAVCGFRGVGSVRFVVADTNSFLQNEGTVDGHITVKESVAVVAGIRAEADSLTVVDVVHFGFSTLELSAVSVCKLRGGEGEEKGEEEHCCLLFTMLGKRKKFFLSLLLVKAMALKRNTSATSKRKNITTLLRIGDLRINPVHILAIDDGGAMFVSIFLSKGIVYLGDKRTRIDIRRNGNDDEPTPEYKELQVFLRTIS